MRRKRPHETGTNMATLSKPLHHKGLDKNTTVLIVEDDKDLAELLVINLRKEGYRTLTAHDGRAALRKVGEEKPALILLDLMIPELTGTEVAARIRTDPAAAAKASGRVLSRQHLLSRAVGPGITVTERTIDVHMTAIRKKLGPYGSCIVTVRGVGYRADPKGEASRV